MRPDLPQSRMKASPVAAESAGYHESPPARHVIGHNRGSTGTPIFPPVGTPPKSSKESPKEVHDRLTAEQLRQQYLSRILAMQLGHASPGSAAPRLPNPFWPSQHPALFACDPALGNPAFVAGKVPVLIGPAGPVAYDVSTMSAFGVPQLVPTFRAFRYQCCVKLLHETTIACNCFVQLLCAIVACNNCMQQLHALHATVLCYSGMQLLYVTVACNCCVQLFMLYLYNFK